MSTDYGKILNALPRPDLYDSWELVKRHMPIEQPPSAASYIVFQKGGQCYAKNGMTGHIEFGPGDAYTVIQSVINALPSRGGDVYFKPDVYILNNFIVVNKVGVNLRGTFWRGIDVGGYRGSVVFKMANGANLDRILSVENWSCLVENIVLDGGGQTGGAGVGLLYVGGGDNVIRNVAVFNSYNRGISAGGHANEYINVAAEYCSNIGWQISNSDECVYIDCHSASNTGTAGWGVWFTGNSKYNRFVGFKSCLNGKDGWTIESLSTDIPMLNTFIGCVATNNKWHGFHIKGTVKNTFIGCVIANNSQEANNTYSGVYLEASSYSNSVNNIFEGNEIHSTTTNKQKYGIYEVDANQDYNIYLGNIISGMATGSIIKQGVNSISEHNIT